MSDVKKLRIFFILGEESGDLLGEKILKSLISVNKNIEFFGLAGNRMEKYDIKSIFPISELSLMGFLEVVPHIPKLIRRLITLLKNRRDNPDIIISIDSQTFLSEW